MNYILINNEDFNIGKILNSGQNFPFAVDNEGFYNVYINKRNVSIKSLYLASIINVEQSFFNNYLKDLFDFNTDYRQIRFDIYNNFPELTQIVNFGTGIRLIKQDLLQTITTFIFSQNNNIKRINKSIDELINIYGSNSFPELLVLKTLSKNDFRQIGAGFRDKYLYSFFQNITDNDLEKLKTLNTDEARNFLMKFNGIGRKVANCILLFALNKKDVFPVDTHIKKIMEKLYFNSKNVKVDEIEAFAIKKFGNLAGYVQQYMFYFAVNNNF